jgi:hypothetical protein
MATFATFLAGMAKPLVAKVMIALGFQVVTITGVVVALDTLKGQMLTWVNQVPAAGLQLALLAGSGEALGIIFGAIAFRVTLWQIQNGTKILGGSN